MKPLYYLGFLPFIGFLSGGYIAAYVDTLLFGLPFLMLWNILWLILSSLIMAVIFYSDDSNRSSNDKEGGK